MSGTTLAPIILSNRQISFERNLPAWKESERNQLRYVPSGLKKTTHRLLTQVSFASAVAKQIKLVLDATLKYVGEAAPLGEGLKRLSGKFSVVIGASALARLPKVWSDAVDYLSFPLYNERRIPAYNFSPFLVDRVRAPLELGSKVLDALATTAASAHWVLDSFPEAQSVTSQIIPITKALGLTGGVIGLATSAQDWYYSRNVELLAAAGQLSPQYKETCSLNTKFHFLKMVGKVSSVASAVLSIALTSLGFLPATIVVAELALSFFANNISLWASYVEAQMPYKPVDHFG